MNTFQTRPIGPRPALDAARAGAGASQITQSGRQAVGADPSPRPNGVAPDDGGDLNDVP
jgi:hypothetical protein